MNRLRLQFFVSYAVVGSFMPLLSLYLRETKAISDFQFSIAMAFMSASHLFSPSLFTLLADLKIDSRHVLAGALAIGTVTLIAIHFTASPVLAIALVAIYGLAQVAMFPLMDGFFFSAAEDIKRSGAEPPHYPAIRVWGTVGFIIPSLVLYFLISRSGGSTASVPLLAAALCATAMLTACFLPKTTRPATLDKAKRKLPTTEALSVLLRGDALWFCITLCIAHAASASYFMFFPLYAEDVAGIEPQWTPLITNYGVLLEIGFTVAATFMVRRFGTRVIFVAGFLVMAARMLVLATFHHPAVLVAVQTFHGLEIIALYILPVIYLNNLATDSFRSSIQGVYIMLCSGLAKIIMFPVAGKIAEHAGLTTLYSVGGTLALIAATLAFIKFRDHVAPSREVSKLPVS